MRPLLLAPGDAVPAGAIAVGGGLAGGDLVLSPGREQTVPASICADTATAMALRLATRQRALLAGHDTVCACHDDTDTLLALALLCHPDRAIDLGPRMIAAGAYDLFTAWMMEAGARLAMVVREHRERHGLGPGLVAHLVDGLDDLITESEADDPARDLQCEQIQSLRSQLINDPDHCPVTLDHHRGSTVVHSLHAHGHHPSHARVHVSDDCPPWALWDIVPHHQFQLLAFADVDGWYYRFCAPRHSWARTHHLPVLAWPDARSLARHLQTVESGPARWRALPAGADFARTCLVASVAETGMPSSSRLAPDQVHAICREHLGARPG